MDIPFENGSFDMVWCAGVLMMTTDEERAMDELTRVLKPGGYLYLLVIASGGMHWPLNHMLQPIAAQISLPLVERAIQKSGISANRSRTILDDLFCPHRDFFFWERLERLFQKRGYKDINRWGPECRLDHEASLMAYRENLSDLLAVFATGDSEEFGDVRSLFRSGKKAIEGGIDGIRWFEDAIAAGKIGYEAAMSRVIGQGHHRVLAIKDA
jgi:SAM-dependent methyltransferase